MTTFFRAWSTAASKVQIGPRGRGQDEAPPKAASWGTDREHQPRKVALASRAGAGVSGAKVGSSQPAFWARQSVHLPPRPAATGLSQLLTLEVEGNRLHDGNISPLAFQPLRSLLYLRLDRNQLRTIPPGLPASLQVTTSPKATRGKGK